MVLYNFLVLYLLVDAAGNFLAPVTSLSPNAYKTVLEIDTVGTFLTSKYVYEKTMQVGRYIVHS